MSICKHTIRSWLLGALMFFMAQQASALTAGAEAYQNQNYPQAFKLLSSEAKGGDSESQYLLGTLYLDGLGASPSTPKAVAWLERAVALKHAEAARSLGKLYISGMGVPMDVDKGIHYFELADEYTPDEEEEECE